MSDLTTSVDSAVGASAQMHTYGLAKEDGKGTLKFSLNGSNPGLKLRTAESTTVVFDLKSQSGQD